MFIVIAVLAALVLGVFLIRGIYREILRVQHGIQSPGIDLMEIVEIGGIQQALYFRGQNAENPVILYIHGGPASTEMQLLHGFQYDWENEFTVVHWDQRQAGKTFLANNPKEVETATFDRMVEDAWEVTQYIQSKLAKDKIIVLGHSWGTILGTALVQTHPQAFSAYIGVGQITNWRENEQIGYNLLLGKARESGNEKDIANIQALGSYLTDAYSQEVFTNFQQVRNYQNQYGMGAGVDMRLALLALTSPYYSLREVLVMFGDVWNYQDELFRYLFTEYDSESFGINYEMPVFYISGENDFIASQTLAQTMLDKIEAPDKAMFYVPEAGHMTMTDNPKEFTRILLLILEILD